MEHLHYGWWDKGVKPSIGNFVDAQNKYTKVILDLIDKRASKFKNKPIKVLDIGCGSGVTLAKLLEKGYAVDGIVPTDHLYKASNEKLDELRAGTNKKTKQNAMKSKIYKCYFEDFLHLNRKPDYDILLFSESFQYIDIHYLYRNINKLLNPQGEVIIADFFSLKRGKAPGEFGGGHFLKDFYQLTDRSEARILVDKDISNRIAPNLDLLDDVLMGRMLPAIKLMDSFFHYRSRFIYPILKFFVRKPSKRLNHKYFSGLRTAANFKKYKSYRLIVLGLKNQ